MCRDLPSEIVDLLRRQPQRRLSVPGLSARLGVASNEALEKAISSLCRDGQTILRRLDGDRVIQLKLRGVTHEL